MATLADVTEAIKSANAGATWITFDVVFPDDETYDRIRLGGVIAPELLARLYRVDPAAVRIYECDAIRTIKATIPRLTSSAGGCDETDFDGTQQYAPLLTVEV